MANDREMGGVDGGYDERDEGVAAVVFGVGKDDELGAAEGVLCWLAGRPGRARRATAKRESKWEEYGRSIGQGGEQCTMSMLSDRAAPTCHAIMLTKRRVPHPIYQPSDYRISIYMVSDHYTSHFPIP